MLKYLYVQIDITGVIFLSIMFFNLCKYKNAQVLYDRKVFMKIIVTNIVVLVIDMISWALNGLKFPNNILVNNIILIIYFSLNPLGCLYFLLYVDYKINENIKRIQKRLPFYIIPFIINIIVTVASPYTHWIFSVDSSNIYHRGNSYLIMPIICFLYLTYAWVLTFIALKKDTSGKNRKLYLNLMCFPILPFIGSIVQTIIYGVSMIWICTAVSIFILFINLQNGQILTDPLTGIYNRRYFERQLINKLRSPTDSFIFVALLDIDKFKSINDYYGHIDGDATLIAVAKLLKDSFESDIVARMGGDEFVIAGERETVNEINAIPLITQDVIDQFNAKNQLSHSISISTGISIFGQNGIDTIDALLHNADKIMYRSKRQKTDESQTL